MPMSQTSRSHPAAATPGHSALPTPSSEAATMVTKLVFSRPLEPDMQLSLVERFKGHPLPLGSLNIRVVDTISDDTSTVYAVKPDYSVGFLILKLYHSTRKGLADAQSEATTYRLMENLQGTAIPRFYGLFEGSQESIHSRAILLEHCGEMKDEFTETQCMQVIAKVEHVHKSGFVYDWENCHIVWRDDKEPIIVDQTSVCPHTNCSYKGNKIVYGCFYPDPEAFGCEIIYDIANEFGVWLRPTKNFGHSNIPIRDVRSVDDILSKLSEEDKEDRSCSPTEAQKLLMEIEQMRMDYPQAFKEEE